MGKNMARIDDNNNVINIEWCSDIITESDTLKEISNYPICIGDTYENGLFYRNGERVLTSFEELSLKYVELNNSYNEGVNSI